MGKAMKTEILYEDKELLVCRKPAGLAVQTDRPGQQDMVSELKNYLAAGNPRTGKSRGGDSCQRPYLGVVHRLDQPVEGLLVFGRTREAAAGLTAQLSRGELRKKYLAVIGGRPPEEAGVLEDYLVKNGRLGGVLEISSPPEKGQAQRAVLHYRLAGRISSPEALSLLDIRIETGRFHQIRIQLSHAGMPLLGDAKYGDDVSRRLSAGLDVRTTALCAYYLALRHPSDGRPMEFTSAPRGKIFSYFDPVCAP